ncbi:MAG TPA: hydantoinase/carbamoylase family amidase [Reyranella sp.]|jgi:beta-ureidopropionase / N-carbamoyl-L-amino-acid hydrolase|nr:hydantoinase/carbamoylase family amidase [Reyranella sp.]
MPDAHSPLDSCIADVWELLERIGHDTTDSPGITRAAWSRNEETAADHIRAFARRHGLQVLNDAFGNIQVLLPGVDPATPCVTTGSHLDSVPHGGNYDGLAGVAAGLAVLAAANADPSRRARPFRVVGMRCEESPWFGTAYLGSRLMLGLSTLDEFGDLKRSDSGKSLRHHLQHLGYPRTGETLAPLLNSSLITSFLELHIEQGPLLEADNIPVGIATAVRGNVRFPDARCIGAYGHSAALPRRFRQDAVLAVAELALGLDGYWKDRIAQGDEDFIVTVGKFSTDAVLHAMTKVAGEVKFSLNIGAAVRTSLDAARTLLFDLVKGIESDRGVTFELGREVGTAPTQMDGRLIALLEDAASALGIAARRMPTVGHDAAMFVRAGVPSAVLLVRNANGSHNSDEALDREDFARGVHVLDRAMHRLASKP